MWISAGIVFSACSSDDAMVSRCFLFVLIDLLTTVGPLVGMTALSTSLSDGHEDG